MRLSRLLRLGPFPGVLALASFIGTSDALLSCEVPVRS